MIITQTNDVNSTVLEDSGHDFGIDTDSMGILFRGFSDSLYSNKIGSIVREITSNCFDAHAELGINKDVVITLNTPDTFLNTPGKISFRDFGVGLSPDRIKNIYSKYFSSTKRDTNGQIGGFGIGAKSPLAYTDIFEVFTVVDDIEYHYMVHRGQKVPRIELLATNLETDRERGTEVIIPIKNTKDLNRFKEEIKTQLKFFDNIQYRGCDIDNEYKIVKGKYFIARKSDTDNVYSPSRMQLCIGKVAYPLDVSQLNGNFYEHQLKSQISLLFNIGELSVTMNRETVEYTEGTAELIEARMEQAKEEIYALRGAQLKTEENILKYISLHCSTQEVTLGDTTFKMPGRWANAVDNTWYFEPLKHLKFLRPYKHVLGDFLKVTHFYERGIIHKKEGKTSSVNLLNLLSNPGTMDLYRAKGSVRDKELSYIKTKLSTDKFAVIKLDVKDPEHFYETQINHQPGKYYYRQLDDEEEKVFLEELRIFSNCIMREFIKHSKSYNDIEVPDQWWKDYRGSTVHKVDKSVITLRIPRPHGETFWLNRTRVDLLQESFKKDRMLMYCFQGEEKEFFDTWYRLRSYNMTDKVFAGVKIARDKVKHFHDFKYFVHIDDIMEHPITKKYAERNKANKGLEILNEEYEQTIIKYLGDEELKVIMSPANIKNLYIYRSFNPSLSFKLHNSKFRCIKSKDPDSEYPEVYHITSGLNFTRFAKALMVYEIENLLTVDLLHNHEFGADTTAYFLDLIKPNIKKFNYINKL